MHLGSWFGHEQTEQNYVYIITIISFRQFVAYSWGVGRRS